MAISSQERSRRKTFILLLEHSVSIAQLKNINTLWVKSILNHYLQCPSYVDKKNIPFYINGFDKIFDKIMNRELFKSLEDIYSEYLPITSTINFPCSYLHIPNLIKNKLSIIKFIKSKPIPLENNYQNYLKGFNADIIYLIKVEQMFYIIDYEFKARLICNTLKYDFIINFCKANNLPCLNSFILINKPIGELSGIIGEKLEDGSFGNNKFIFKESI